MGVNHTYIVTFDASLDADDRRNYSWIKLLDRLGVNSVICGFDFTLASKAEHPGFHFVN